MFVIGQPLYFEDTTGMIHNTDLDDIYDRMFFRVVQKKLGPQKGLVCIYDRGRRSFRNSAVETMPPSVIMDFGPKGLSLGSIAVGQMPPMPMKDYLRKMGTWGRYVEECS